MKGRSFNQLECLWESVAYTSTKKEWLRVSLTCTSVKKNNGHIKVTKKAKNMVVQFPRSRIMIFMIKKKKII